jgi:hypothetical protein
VYGAVTIEFPPLDEAWYVADYGYDAADGRTRTTALPSVEKALVKIKDAHLAAKSVAPTAPNGLTGATIVVIGTSGDTKTININNSNTTHPATIYPPITLRGLSPAQPGILTANKVFDNPGDTNAYRVLVVRNGAVVTLGNDLTITGGGQKEDVGSGAGVTASNATLTMNGGTITANKVTSSGGGVSISNGAIFTMNGGTISYNSATNAGGVGVSSGTGTFLMNGGIITHNTAVSAGGGLQTAAGTTFKMTGGTISDNTASTLGGGGVNIGDGTFTMSGGTITGNTAPQHGGGVGIFNSGTYILTGGTITGNIAGMEGGGVCLTSGTNSFTMQGGIIAGNTAAAGGGVAVQGGTFQKQPENPGGSSGIIYGSNGEDNSNTATLAASTLQNHGHAVYVAGPKTREVTAGQGDHLDSAVPGASGGWVE